MGHLSMNVNAKTFSELKEKVIKTFAFLETSEIGNEFSISIGAHTVQDSGPIGQIRADYEAKAASILEEAKTEKVEAPKEKKAKKEKAPVEVPSEVTAAVNFEEKTLTKEDIQDACQKVSETKGIDAAKAVLAAFKSGDGKPCRRISDVQVSDYAAFIEKCAE